MMRELKFRAWDKKRKEILRITMMDFAEWWVSCRPPGTQVDPLEYGERNSFKNEETDRHILIQYTGLKDKNGKEIYEGYVVKHSIEPIEINYIEFYDAQYHLEPHGLRLCDEYKEIEVIGNIYENPELIKEKK